MSSATPMFWLLTGIYLVANIPFKMAAVISGMCGRSDAESPSTDPDPDYFGLIGGMAEGQYYRSMAIVQLFAKGQLNQEPPNIQKIEKAESIWKSTKFGQ